MSAMLEFALRYFMPENMLLTPKNVPFSGADEQVITLEEVTSLCDQAFRSEHPSKSENMSSTYSRIR